MPRGEQRESPQPAGPLLSANSTGHQDRPHTIRPHQIITKEKDNHINYWTSATKTQSKLQCYSALNRQCPMADYLSCVTDPRLRKTLAMYKLSNSLAVETGRHRQTWLPREDRLCTHCTQGEVETELHFLTTCQLYQDTYFPQIADTQRDFETLDPIQKLPYLLGEVQQCANIAGRFLYCCDQRRTSSGQEGQTETVSSCWT
ncbi:hypothetical protein D5F01_LYC04306 [Larimichthys crocea]|uniref:Reverse transcriptase zinc-binding domain-containing protein n=1 Tax=Larimichthys crocea TaxID=215358 RepID=A0A6G0J1N7_LARCR|nr:hypothetical protein D5F01_LYC04306 [Larimichthys crocea]